jgi:hypothetical protein
LANKLIAEKRGKASNISIEWKGRMSFWGFWLIYLRFKTFIYDNFDSVRYCVGRVKKDGQILLNRCLWQNIAVDQLRKLLIILTQNYSNEQKEKQSSKDYSINAEFWKHHDTMRQKKMENYLTINSIFAAAIAVLISRIIPTTQTISIIITISISIIGIAISITWHSVMCRNSEYMRFQRLQLCSIERDLPGSCETFTKMYNAFDKGEEVSFPEIQEKFKSKTKSANELDGLLMKMMASFWAVVAIISFIFLVFGLP